MPVLRDPLYALLRLLALLPRDEAVSRVEAEAPAREELASRLPTAPVDALGPRWPADLSLTPAPPPARS